MLYLASHKAETQHIKQIDYIKTSFGIFQSGKRLTARPLSKFART